jgi:hypothetical protein
VKVLVAPSHVKSILWALELWVKLTKVEAALSPALLLTLINAPDGALPVTVKDSLGLPGVIKSALDMNVPLPVESYCRPGESFPLPSVPRQLTEKKRYGVLKT